MVEALFLEIGEGVFADDVRGLEVVVAVDEDHHAAEVEVAEGVFGVFGLAGEAEPEDVDGNAVVDDGEMGGGDGGGVAAVAAYGEVGGDVDGTVWSFGANAGDGWAVRAIGVEKIGGFVLHEEVEVRVLASFAGEEVEEIPLGHKGDESGVGGKVGEVGQGKGLAANGHGEGVDLRVGDLEEAVEEAQLVEDFEGGGVNGVAAEVAKEVLVFFEDGDGETGAGEEKAEHDAGGAAADDAGGLGHGLGSWGRACRPAWDRVVHGREELRQRNAAAFRWDPSGVRYRWFARCEPVCTHAAQLFRKARRSALIASACVVGMPCGKSL